ncbi:MAG: hypothetical protein HY730_08920 [Candidatus Tectomicrobia bacterium]|uniref:Uncharacterized protein n=1 Tax=Tectimicrobiota bacterium TaxID=2528274 RepID=A0A933GM74_UNCTE|nr:hypothetical protein [Candidatus Tectomicrobia bacterium]
MIREPKIMKLIHRLREEHYQETRHRKTSEVMGEMESRIKEKADELGLKLKWWIPETKQIYF